MPQGAVPQGAMPQHGVPQMVLQEDAGRAVIQR